MRDLESLRARFSSNPADGTRVAFIHTSPRMAIRRDRNPEYRFVAHFPGLGVLNLAHSLRNDRDTGLLAGPVEVEYFDEECFETLDGFIAAVTEWLAPAARPILATSAYTWTIEYLEKLLARFPADEVLIAVGGPHATLAPDIEMAHVVVRGEGGAAIRHIVNAALTPAFGTGDEARGVCYVSNRAIHIDHHAFDRSLEILPSPGFAFDLLPHGTDESPVYSANMWRYLGRRPQIYVCTQSCRARCTFCSTYLIHGQARARPIDLVRQDLHYLVEELKHDCIEFHDDDLLQHPEFEELLGVMKDLGVPWFCYGRVPPITEAIAKAMRESGCRRVFLGVESMDQETLDYFRKNTTVAENERAVSALAEAGIGVLAGMIIGAPHHTVDSMLQAMEAFLQLPLLFLYVSILSPDPGTVEYRRAIKSGEAFVRLNDESTMRLIPDITLHGGEAPRGLPTVCRGVGKRDLNRLRETIEYAFYFRPEQLAQFDAALERPEQRVVVDDYYRYLEDRASATNWDATDSRIREVFDEVMAGWTQIADFRLATHAVV